MIHLDTSFLIRGLARGTPEDRRLREWLTNGESLAVSCVAWAEFLCGPMRDVDVELAQRLVGEPVEWTVADAGMTAQLYELAANGTSGMALVSGANALDVDLAGDIAFLFFLNCQ
jgi:predicted nucleic acid-binding protein